MKPNKESEILISVSYICVCVCVYTRMHIYIRGSTHGVMIIVVGNGYGDLSLNPG